MKKDLRSERGSITIFVLASCLFFLVSVIGVFEYTKNKQISVEDDYRQIKLNYERDINNQQEIYDSKINEKDIEISFKSQEVYLIPTGSNTCTISQQFTIENILGKNIKSIGYGWSNNENIEPVNWEFIPIQTPSSIARKTDAVEGNYYLWVKVIEDNNSEKKEKTEVSVLKREISISQSNLNAVITYPDDVYIYNKKVGQGSSESAAIADANHNTNITVPISTTFMYVEGNDSHGNKIYMKKKNIAIGSIVKYEPEGTYTWNAKYATAYVSNLSNYNKANKTLQTVATGNSITSGNQDMSIRLWKVLSVENNEIKMIPSELDNSANSNVTMYGAQGYNNAVSLLDEACSALYSNSSKGISAESIGIDDIEGLLEKAKVDSNNDGTYDWQYAKSNYSSGTVTYNNQYSSQYTATNSYYPVIYEQEKLRAIGSESTPSTTGLDLFEKPNSKIERSEDTSLFNIGAIIGSVSKKLKPTQTYYSFSNIDFSNYLGSAYSGIILPNGVSTNYWVASRCIDVGDSSCSFGVRYVNSGCLASNNVFNSNGDEFAYDGTLFPIVSIYLDNLTEAPVGETDYQFYVI